MKHGIREQVQKVAWYARLLVWLHGTSWFVATTSSAGLAVGVADYLLRFQDAGVRVICSAIVGGGVVWAFWRFIFPALKYECTDLQVARRVEQHIPALRDRLSSAVAFSALAGEDVTAGSEELRRLVILQTETAARSWDFRLCLDYRPSLRALTAAVLASGVVLVVSLLNGPVVALAARRMVLPFGSEQWPRRHVLTFINTPTRLAAGQDFEVELVDANGRLPDRVEIHYWFDGDDISQSQTQAMQPLGHKLTHRRANVTRGFRYRASGGDDLEMPWIQLEIIEPPRIVDQEILIHPPAYTGLPVQSAAGNFRALHQTRVGVRIRVNQRISKATLETDTSEDSQPIPMALDPDRLGFSLKAGADSPWIIAKSGFYGFHLVGDDGLDSGIEGRWEVDAVADTPPTVSLNRPANVLRVTATATVVLEAIVKDDLAVPLVELEFVRSDQSDQDKQTTVLWNEPANSTSAAIRWDDDGIQRNVQHRWDLSSVPGLEPGEWVDFLVVATDNFAQRGESASRRLTIISSEELEDRIAQRQSEILARIAKVVQLERETHAQVKDLEIQIAEVQSLSRDDVDQLHSAELNQRQVRQHLGQPTDGVEAQIAALLEELQSNQVDSPEAVRRLRLLIDAVHALNKQKLPQIQLRLIDAARIAREDFNQRREASEPMLDPSEVTQLSYLVRQAADGQLEVILSLEKMLGELSQWDSYRRLAREVSRLRREQSEIRQRTERLRIDTLTKDLRDLTAQERADLRRLAERQNDGARSFSALRSRVQETRDELEESDPVASATLSDALDMIQQTGVGGTMRDVADNIGRNQLGQAAEQQEEVIRQLTNLQGILANRREHQLDKMIDQLRDAAGQLGQLQQRQWQVRDQADDLGSMTDSQLRVLAAEQSDIADQTRQLARRLNRLDAKQAEQALGQAAQEMDSAAQAVSRRQSDELNTLADKANQQLNEAQRHLQQAIRGTEERLSNERLGRLRQSLTDLYGRQQHLVSETQNIEQGRISPGRPLTREQRETVDNLAADQTKLEDDVLRQKNEVSDVEMFSIALSQIAGEMAAVVANLERYDTGSITLQRAQRAADLIERFLSTLDPAEPGTKPPGDHQQDTANPAAEKKDPRAQFVHAQLKIIRMMQQDLNQETLALEAETREVTAWKDDEVRKQQELTRRQGQLADLLLRLLDPDPQDAAADDLPTQRVDRDVDDGWKGLDQILEQGKRR